MIEGHDFVDAYFTNNERTIVESIWWSTKEEVYRTHLVKAEEENEQWQELLKVVTVDELHDNTYAKMREGRKSFEQVILHIANKDGMDVDDILSDENKTIDFIIDWFDGDFDNEKLFKIKLRLFERDKVMNSKDRKLKANLRKASTLLQVIEAYSKF